MSKVKFAGRIHTPIQIYHLHSHPYWEVVCYTQGIGTVEIDGNIVSFETGDIFFLPPGSIHSDHADDGFKNIHYEFEDASFPYHTWIKIRDTDSGDFLSVITRLYNEYQMKRKNYAEIVDSLHDVLLHYLIAFSDQGSPSSLCRNSHQPNRYKLLRPFLRLESNNDSHSYESRLFP